MSFSQCRKIVANYSSSSEEDTLSEIDEKLNSVDAGSDTSDSDYATDGSVDDINLEEILKPIEELNITVPPEQIFPAGTIKHTVSNQVVVQPKRDLTALDLDTILFYDEGKRALGRINDVFGPVHEPLYVVYFNSANEIKDRGIQAGMSVYYAPETDHTSYVEVPKLMKMKGSDASWKYNREPPPECQEYSDDEEEKAANGKTGNPFVASNIRPIWRSDDHRPPRKPDSCRNQRRTPNRPFRPHHNHHHSNRNTFNMSFPPPPGNFPAGNMSFPPPGNFSPGNMFQTPPPGHNPYPMLPPNMTPYMGNGCNPMMTGALPLSPQLNCSPYAPPCNGGFSPFLPPPFASSSTFQNPPFPNFTPPPPPPSSSNEHKLD